MCQNPWVGHNFEDTPVLVGRESAPQEGSSHEERHGVQEQGEAEGREGPDWSPAVKPLLIPELGSEIRTAALWADGLVCETGARPGQEAAQAWPQGHEEGRGRGLVKTQVGGGGDSTAFT